MTESFQRRVAAAVFAVALLAACSGDPSHAGKKNGRRLAGGSAKSDDSAAGSVDLGNTSYKPGPLAAIGSVSGTIKLTGPVPNDSTTVNKDQAICGTKSDGAVVTSKSGGLSNAIVWIADVKTGKPLTNDKRKELSSEKCLLDPRVQAAVVGTTFDVYNDDKLLHRLIFTTLGTDDTLTVMPFFNVGQVVASERLAKHSGIVEVRCVQHPWTHGYIAIFDHPYFAVTNDDGSFKMDSLPPGSYKMMVWHEGMPQPVAQQVQVAAGGTAKVDLGVTIGSLR